VKQGHLPKGSIFEQSKPNYRRPKRLQQLSFDPEQLETERGEEEEQGNRKGAADISSTNLNLVAPNIDRQGGFRKMDAKPKKKVHGCCQLREEFKKKSLLAAFMKNVVSRYPKSMFYGPKWCQICQFCISLLACELFLLHITYKREEIEEFNKLDGRLIGLGAASVASVIITWVFKGMFLFNEEGYSKFILEVEDAYVDKTRNLVEEGYVILAAYYLKCRRTQLEMVIGKYKMEGYTLWKKGLTLLTLVGLIGSLGYIVYNEERYTPKATGYLILSGLAFFEAGDIAQVILKAMIVSSCISEPL